jgi:hypothetical protein
MGELTEFADDLVIYDVESIELFLLEVLKYLNQYFRQIEKSLDS